MERSPDEGVDDEGFIVSGADVELIPPLYGPLLETCVSTLVAAVEGLVAVYLYGSVATGQASPPESDLDLLVVTHDDTASEGDRRLHGEFHGPVPRSGARRRHRSRDRGWAVRRRPRRSRESMLHQALLRPAAWRRPPVPAPVLSTVPAMAWAFNHNIADAIEPARQQLDLAANE